MAYEDIKMNATMAFCCENYGSRAKCRFAFVHASNALHSPHSKELEILRSTSHLRKRTLWLKIQMVQGSPLKGVQMLLPNAETVNETRV